MFLLGLAVIGCGPSEEIRSYTVPKPPPPPVGEYRILGAMYPADQPTWFFKATGKHTAIEAQFPAIEKLFTSVKFPPEPNTPPRYDSPAGWQSTGPTGLRLDTLKFGTGENAIELTVSQAKGEVSGNASRWAGQVGATFSLSKQTSEITTTSGIKGIRVDVSGPTNPTGPGGPFMGK